MLPFRPTTDYDIVLKRCQHTDEVDSKAGLGSESHAIKGMALCRALSPRFYTALNHG
jgi:hypothetical protein